MIFIESGCPQYIIKLKVIKMNKQLTDADIAIVYCLHGDEILGKEICDKLRERFPQIIYIEGDPKAMVEKKRFIEKDLNRSFPGNNNGSYEEKLAHSLMEKLHDKKVVIDLHQTNTISEPFLIITKKVKNLNDLVNCFPIRKVVLMDKTISNGKALIDHVKNGFSIEFGKNTSSSEAFTITEEGLRNILTRRRVLNKSVYRVTSIIERTNQFAFLDIANFSLVKKGAAIAKSSDATLVANYDFYPIFYGEKTFQNFLCLRAQLVGEFK
jgi:succinylglutamate desuccinylase